MVWVRRLACLAASSWVLLACQPSALPQEPTPLQGEAVASSTAPVAYDAPRLTPDEVQAALLRREALVIVDVRSAEAFGKERIAGAVSAPWSDLVMKQAELPKDKLLVLYCT